MHSTLRGRIACQIDVKAVKQSLWSKLGESTSKAPALTVNELGTGDFQLERRDSVCMDDESSTQTESQQSDWPTFQETISSV
jgi:hypothetical protein